MIKQKFLQLKQFFREHPRARWIAAGLAVGVIGLIVLLVMLNNSLGVSRIDTEANTTEQGPQLEPSPTTGLDVSPDIAKRPVLSSIISNSVGARPQAGLSSADIVFETIAEGGITRYLAFFHDQSPENIGPVRSLRPYFIDWAVPFDAALAHVGGSPIALDQANTRLKDRDIDEFRFGRQVFTRVGSRLPPHNTYTSFDRLMAAAKDSLNMTTSDVKRLERAESKPADADAEGNQTDGDETTSSEDDRATPSVTSISIPFSSASYNTAWDYDQNSQTYKRKLAGVAHKDADTQQQIAVDAVIVIKTKFGSYVHGGTTYADPDSVGSGDAFIFQDGEVIKTKWQRQKDGQYSFTKDGSSIGIKKGKLWIAIQPTNQTLSYD